MLNRIRSNLWETPTFSPVPGLTTHAYLWTPPSGENVLFYSPGDESAFDAIDDLGGVAHQYLSHRDEAGPMLRRIAERFDAVLHAPAGDLAGIEQHAAPDVLLEGRAVDQNGVEVIPTPGHTPGSTSFVVTGTGGARYLFTGDTAFRGADGAWRAGYFPGLSDPDRLRSSLEILAGLEPDVVASSAFAGERGAHEVDAISWRDDVRAALQHLVTP